MTEQEIAESSRGHSEGVEKRNVLLRNACCFLEVIRDQREVCEACRDQRSSSYKDPKCFWESLCFRIISRFPLHLMGTRMRNSRNHQRSKAQQRRNQQHGKSVAVAALQVKNQRYDQGTDCGAGLIQSLIQSKDPTASDGLTSV